MALLQGSIRPLGNRLHFLQSQFVSWLLAAIDGHGKNFSLALLPGADYELTPLYDVLSAYPAVEAGELHEKERSMAMALEGGNRHYQWLEIKPRHWLETAGRAGVSKRQVNDAIDSVLGRVPEVIETVDGDVRAIDPRVGAPILDRMASAARRFERFR